MGTNPLCRDAAGFTPPSSWTSNSANSPPSFSLITPRFTHLFKAFVIADSSIAPPTDDIKACAVHSPEKYPQGAGRLSDRKPKHTLLLEEADHGSLEWGNFRLNSTILKLEFQGYRPELRQPMQLLVRFELREPIRISILYPRGLLQSPRVHSGVMADPTL